MNEDRSDAEPGLPCAYERVIIGRVGACSRATRVRRGGRRRVACSDEHAQRDCVELLNTLRKGANFTLGLTRQSGALRLEQATKLQCGGLLGLQHELDRIEKRPRVDDIHALVNRALRRFGSWVDLPLAAILRAVSAYRHQGPSIRHRRRG